MNDVPHSVDALRFALHAAVVARKLAKGCSSVNSSVSLRSMVTHLGELQQGRLEASGTLVLVPAVTALLLQRSQEHFGSRWNEVPWVIDELIT